MTSAQHAEFTLTEHLQELRKRLFRMTIAIGVVFIGLFMVADQLYTLLAAPLMSVLPEHTQMIATGTLSPFMVQLKLTLYASIVLLIPYLLFEIWGFIAPGLYQHERSAIFPLMLASIVCFLIGVAFCYGVVIPMVVKFMAGHVPVGVAYQPDVMDYLSTVLGLFLTFGFAFELPVLVVLLAKTGLVSYQQLSQSRRYVIVGIFVLAAVVTPPDIISQLLLALPLCLFYELALLIVRLTAPASSALADMA